MISGILAIVILCIGVWIVIFIVLAVLLTLTAAILSIIDVCLEGGRIAKSGKVAQVNEPVASNDSKLAAAETFEKKLAKLNAMKEHGIITEEEYTEIKKTYVKEFL